MNVFQRTISASRCEREARRSNWRTAVFGSSRTPGSAGEVRLGIGVCVAIGRAFTAEHSDPGVTVRPVQTSRRPAKQKRLHGFSELHSTVASEADTSDRARLICLGAQAGSDRLVEEEHRAHADLETSCRLRRVPQDTKTRNNNIGIDLEKIVSPGEGSNERSEFGEGRWLLRFEIADCGFCTGSDTGLLKIWHCHPLSFTWKVLR